MTKSFFEDVEGDIRVGRLTAVIFAALLFVAALGWAFESTSKFYSSLTPADRLHIQQMRIELAVYLSPGSALELRDGSMAGFLHRGRDNPDTIVAARADGRIYGFSATSDRDVYNIVRIIRPADPDYSVRKDEFIKRQLNDRL